VAGSSGAAGRQARQWQKTAAVAAAEGLPALQLDTTVQELRRTLTLRRADSDADEIHTFEDDDLVGYGWLWHAGGALQEALQERAAVAHL
jgi:hypothetical protein